MSAWLPVLKVLARSQNACMLIDSGRTLLICLLIFAKLMMIALVFEAGNYTKLEACLENIKI